MTIKNQVLHALEANRGTQLSGSSLGQQLGVSRTAIWKAIQSLREDGLLIESTQGGGYALFSEDDSLTASGISVLLQTNQFARNLTVLPSVTSTNSLLKTDYADAPHGFCLFSEEQTAGRGRLGRSFVSPSGKGLYFSLLLRPDLPLARMNFLTITAAVAVCLAIEETCGFSPQIKWVNDILMQGKKLCGILTEVSLEGETGALSSVILGIGVNLRFDTADSPELADIAAGLSDFTSRLPRRSVLAASILNHLEALYFLLEQNRYSDILAEYSKRLCCLNQSITVLTPKERVRAFCTGITSEGHLLVTTEAGEQRTLSSGEISIRL